MISIAFLTALSVAADEKPSSDALNKVRKDDVVAVCGDSITAGGYSLLIESYLSMCYKDVPVKTVKFGWPGDSMGSFWGRKCGAEPILSVHPSIVTLCYGMNDGGYKALGKDTARHYRNGMEKLVQELKKNGVRTVIIGSPTAVDTTTYRNKKNNLTASDYNSVLAALGDSAKQLAEEQGSVFVNIHDLMLDVMAKAKAKYGAEYHVAGKEGVHPSGNGNLVIAYAFLKAMGCDGNIGTITVDLSGGKAEASAGHKILSFKDGVVEVESSRYPFCFKGKPDDPSATSGIIEFFPFNEDLNRFKLVVTGQKAGSKIRVTWGQATKEYSSDNLAKGINLAADFIENPFCEPFGKVYWIIVDKKSKWETRQYAYILSRLPVLQEDMKKEIGGLDPGEQN
ncbi:MAG: hypothetical protein A2X45_04635, partial [Lentisphaerae bacterium GWF2_50_93]